MAGTVRLTVDDLLDAAGRPLGPGSWRAVDREAVDAFAEATGAPADGGWLLLSLVPSLLAELLDVVDKRSGVNYGVEHLRVGDPVGPGDRVRLTPTVAGAVAVDGGARSTLDVTVEAEGRDRPAMVGAITYLAYR